MSADHTPALTDPLRLLVARLINYATNHVIANVPSFAIRHLWYRRVLGIVVERRAGIHLGCYVWYFGVNQVRRDGFRIGAGSTINRRCTLDARGHLEIGENVSVSPEVVILTASHRLDDASFALTVRPVVIEDNVFIGTRATILPGVRLGRGCVVAAGAVVTRDVSPLAVVGGIPARAIDSRPEEAAHYVMDKPFPLFE